MLVYLRDRSAQTTVQLYAIVLTSVVYDALCVCVCVCVCACVCVCVLLLLFIGIVQRS